MKINIIVNGKAKEPTNQLKNAVHVVQNWKSETANWVYDRQS